MKEVTVNLSDLLDWLGERGNDEATVEQVKLSYQDVTFVIGPEEEEA